MSSSRAAAPVTERPTKRSSRRTDGRSTAVDVIIGPPPGSLGAVSASFLVFLLLIWVAAVLVHWYNLPTVGFLYAIPALFLYSIYWRRYRRTIYLRTVVRMFAGGFIPAVLFSLTAQVLLTILFALACFGSAFSNAVKEFTESQDMQSVMSKLEIERDVGYYAFLVLSAYITAGFVEEFAKIMVLRCSCMKNPICLQPSDVAKSKRSAHATLILLITVSLGFSTLENTLYTFSGGARDGVATAVGVAVLRSLIALPSHTLCSMFSALMLARRDLEDPDNRVSWIRVVFPGAFVHGTYDLMVILVSSELQPYWSETARTALVVCLAVSLLVGAFIFWYKRWKRLITYVARLEQEGAEEETEYLVSTTV